MSINAQVKRIIEDRGVTQKWVIERMNSVHPEALMDRNKMSAVINEKRKMSCDEFLAFCMALEVSPDLFMAT